MSLIELFLGVANNNDKEWLLRSFINRALGHDMQVQKKERSLSRNLGEDASHQKEVEDRFVFGDSGDEPRKDNQQEVERWCNAIRLVPFEGVEGLVKQQIAYLTQLNENPKHSDRTIEEWTKALEGQFETEELAKGYAISMLNQQAANSFSDWTEFGGSVELDVIAEINSTEVMRNGYQMRDLDYPEEMDDVIKDRVEKMIGFLDRRPNIRALGKRFELVHMLK
tara:strand:+ start:52 stop:723 length:672 start_codon:yes stop_codon:yes gene_type:complete